MKASSTNPRFVFMDVFGQKKYGGGQLTTFLNCHQLSSRDMQNIATELNFPETTFILSDKPVNGGYDVRIFTPKAEVDFAGHPTLGTAYVIQNYILKKAVAKIKLNLKVGQITVEFKDNKLWMEQVEPVFNKVLEAKLLAKTLSMNVDDIDTKYPIQEVSTGLPFTIVPLKNLNSLENAKINLDVYNNEFISKTSAKGILIFANNENGGDHQLRTRVFVNYLGIPEDPATGSASGCLAGYLAKYNFYGNHMVDTILGQAYEMNRHASIAIRSHIEDESIKILVGGGVNINASGVWQIK